MRTDGNARANEDLDSTEKRIGQEVTIVLRLMRFYEDYKNGPAPDLFGKLQEEFNFVSQSLPKTTGE